MNTEILNLHKLAVFAAVVERGSFSKASEDLYLSEPCVSKHIRTLESLYGVRLLERSKRPVVPTEAGRIVYHFAKKAIYSLEDLDDAMHEFVGGQTGNVAIGASITIGNYLLPPIISRFKRQLPGAEIVLQIAAPQYVYQAVQNGELQFAVTAGVNVPKNLAVETLCKDKLVLVAAPNHHLASREKVTVQDLADQGFIHSSPGSPIYEMMLETLGGLGFRPRILMTIDHVEAAKRAMQEGLGISFLFRISVEREIRSGELVELKFAGPPFWGTYNLIYDPARYQSPLSRRFLSFVREQVSALSANGALAERQ